MRDWNEDHHSCNEALSAQLKEDEPRLISMYMYYWNEDTFSIEVLIGIGALIDKNKFDGRWLERVRLL